MRETNNSYTNMRNYRLLTTEESEFLSARSPSGRAETGSHNSVNSHCGVCVCVFVGVCVGVFVSV